jgi:hypothetical protein
MGSGSGISPPGDVLSRKKFLDINKPHGFVNQTDSTLAFVGGATRQFTITPVGGSFKFYQQGVKYVKTVAENVNITNTEGIWFFYYNNGVLTASQVPWTIGVHVPVALLSWDATNLVALDLAEERHMTTMSSATHEYLHDTRGTVYDYGLAAGDYTLVGTGALDTDAQLSISDGDIHDEDIEVEIRDGLLANKWEQPLAVPAEIPMYYRDGASGVWRRDVATTFPLKQGSGGTPRIKWNDESGPWTQPDASTPSDYVAVWIFATNNMDEPVIGILGQRDDSNFQTSLDENNPEDLNLGTLPFVEGKLLYRLIFQTGAYANTPKARLRHVKDYRATRVGTVNATLAIADHSGLSGRAAANQHPGGAVDLDTSAFAGNLSPADDDVQKAMDTLDDMVLAAVPPDSLQTLDAGPDTTTSASYVQLSRLTKTVKNNTKYILWFFYERANSLKDQLVSTRIQVNDAATIEETLDHFQDNNTKVSVGGVYFFNNTAGTTLNVDLDGATAGGTLTVTDFRIVLMEITEV